jgi:alpha-1,6-mannosyltransferase
MVFCDINVFLSPKGGGIKTYHARKARWYADARPDDRYVTIQPARGSGHRLGISHNIEHIRLPGRKIGTNYRIFFSYAHVRQAVQDMEVDVLEAGDPYLTARFGGVAPARVRTSFWHSDPQTAYFDQWASPERFGSSLRRMATRVAASWITRQQRYFDLVWCASDWAADNLRGRGITNVEVLPFGTDKGTFKPQPRDRAWLASMGLDPDRPVLLYAGRLDREKGIATLMRGLEDLLRLPSRPQILVSGRGYYQEFFEAFRHPDYRYLGYLTSTAEMARLYSSADLLIATCSVETFGLAVLEALTSGLPTLSANDGGGSEVVRKSGAGVLFQAGDTQDMVRRAGEFLTVAGDFRDKAAAFGAAWPSWDDFFAGQHARTLELWRDSTH